MNCKGCGYRLWNLASRQCPECGDHFRVSEFEFVRGSVAFCCPHCDNAYYGTSERGHLQPSSFTCVKCHNAIDMESMLLRPAEGVEEVQTEVAKNPWVQRPEIGFWRSFFRTVRMALLEPATLIRHTPPLEERRESWNFAAWAILVSNLLGPGLVFAIPFVIAMAFSLGRNSGLAVAAVIVIGFVLMTAVGVLVSLLYILLWGLCTQGVLRLSGHGHKPIGYTFRALCYSTGANVTTIIPCLGTYMGWIWWLVSAVIMTKEAHRISAGRAALSVLILPGGLLGLGVAVYAVFFMFIMSAAGTVGPGGAVTFGPIPGGATAGRSETQALLNAYQSYAVDIGVLPDHPVELLKGDRIQPMDIISSETMSSAANVRWPRLALISLMGMVESDKVKAIDAFVSRLPDGAFAHRAGDFVFTCPGVDPSTLSSDVWLVIFSPMQLSSSRNRPPANVYVGRADGTVVMIPWRSFQASLQGQMAVRKENNLPPLPPMNSITHRQSAVAEEE